MYISVIILWPKTLVPHVSGPALSFLNNVFITTLNRKGDEAAPCLMPPVTLIGLET